MRNWLYQIALFGLLAATLPVHAAGDAAAGKDKSVTCAGCHGADGNSPNPIWPKLAGQHASYTVKQLKDFKAGNRTNPTMSPMAAPLSEQDKQDLAAHFSGLSGSTGTANPDMVALGEKIYRGGNTDTGVSACAGCHSPSGVGNPAAGFPAVAGQHAAYVTAQLNAFKDGTRGNDAARMMQNIAARMSSAEIEAVASYIQGLH